MLNKFWIILKSKFSNKENLGSWYNERLMICHMCPHNSKNISLWKYDLRMWKWYVLNLFQPFCSVCGCQITAKASIEIEECELEEPKWTSIL